jgi:hypothetical protein
MIEQAKSAGSSSRWKLSLDTWVVLAAFLVSLLIRVGIVKHFPW